MNRKTRRAIYEIILLALAVLLIRLLYVEVFLRLQDDYGLHFERLLSGILSNYALVLLMLAADYLIVRLLNKKFDYGKTPIIRFGIEFLSICLLAVVLTFGLNLSTPLTGTETLPLLPAAFGIFLINAVVVAIIDMAAYNRKAHKKALDTEILKRQQARHQYTQLKQQLNPHFLFNSLNVLDYLVHTDPDKASDFIRKLAGVYRYLLNKENNLLVTLKEELDFALLYADLLKERFSHGMELRTDVANEYHTKKIIPCGLQLLLENAVKHNIISPDDPLHIAIVAEENSVAVYNNIQPRMHPVESTGVGLKNIKGQYKTAFRKSIQVEQHNGLFSVRIPLID